MSRRSLPHRSRPPRRRRQILAVVAIVVLGIATISYFGGPRRTLWLINHLVVQPTRPPEPAATRSERWLQELEYLRTNLYRLHANAFHTTTRADFERAFGAARGRLGTATDAEATLELMRLIALVGDGHTATWSHLDAPAFPLRVAEVGGTWSVTGAGPEHVDLLAAELVALDATPVGAAVERLGVYLSADSEADQRARVARMVTLSELTHAAGLQRSAEVGRFAFRLPDGTLVERELAVAAPGSPIVTVTSHLLSHRDPHLHHWVEWRPEWHAVYLRYRSCRDHGAFRAVAEETLTLLDTHAEATLVVDLRGNGGGDSSVIRPLLQGLRERDAGGRTVALIDVGTASSATMNALDLRSLGATLAGEATADARAGWGEIRGFVLPNSGMRVSVSTYRFGGDPAPVEPDLRVLPSATAWLAGEDPVLQAALER
jgi:hypothetical protein